MLRNLLNYPINAINSGKNRSLTIRSSWYLGDAMKKFNDNKEYEKALQLFDEHKEKDLLKISKFHLTQALISSVGIRDLNRALAIDQMLPLKLKKDGYIVASLIQVASNWKACSSIDLLLLTTVICDNIDLDESFFQRAKKKDPVIYWTMMKGKFSLSTSSLMRHVQLIFRLHTKWSARKSYRHLQTDRKSEWNQSNSFV